jgi:hypothetical protein
MGHVAWADRRGNKLLGPLVKGETCHCQKDDRAHRPSLPRLVLRPIPFPVSPSPCAAFARRLLIQSAGTIAEGTQRIKDRKSEGKEKKVRCSQACLPSSFLGVYGTVPANTP